MQKIKNFIFSFIAVGLLAVGVTGCGAPNIGVVSDTTAFPPIRDIGNIDNSYGQPLDNQCPFMVGYFSWVWSQHNGQFNAWGLDTTQGAKAWTSIHPEYFGTNFNILNSIGNGHLENLTGISSKSSYNTRAWNADGTGFNPAVHRLRPGDVIVVRTFAVFKTWTHYVLVTAVDYNNPNPALRTSVSSTGLVRNIEFFDSFNTGEDLVFFPDKPYRIESGFAGKIKAASRLQLTPLNSQFVIYRGSWMGNITNNLVLGGRR